MAGPQVGLWSQAARMRRGCSRGSQFHLAMLSACTLGCSAPFTDAQTVPRAPSSKPSGAAGA